MLADVGGACGNENPRHGFPPLWRRRSRLAAAFSHRTSPAPSLELRAERLRNADRTSLASRQK
jgi:hypothetical protein